VRIQYYTATSLDGFIAGEGDDLDWLTGYEPPEPPPDLERDMGSYDEFYAGIGALIMGSSTYEWVLEHVDAWPYADKPAWVLSSRDLRQPEGDADVRIVAADVADLQEELEAAAGDRNLWVVGGGPVVSQFAAAGLLDDVIVTVVPVVLGSGKPMFSERLPGGPMKLVGTRPTPTGMVELHYEVVPAARSDDG
jgi:dihydrofolate reductase